jgi:2-keto-4-pentenoate hydratase/2-oxohepta-3-ene-1,7-dioic acid hydratase in catechol pathway
MRLASYVRSKEVRTAIEVGGAVVDTEHAARAEHLEDGPEWTSARSVISAGPAVWARLVTGAVDVAAAGGEGVLAEDGLIRLAPVPDPEKIVCLGLNYRDHAAEANLPLPVAPMLFAKYRNSLVGPSADIVLPEASEVVDYEAELAVVIGATCKDVSEADALAYVAGVTGFNDVSARDLQLQTSQWMAGKAIDTFAPCGPVLVTLDEIDDIQRLGLRARVNGTTVQDGTTADMIFPVAQTVAHLSRLMTLVPGDIIATGTPAGVGFKRDPQVLLNDGDVVEVEIDGIGVLRNPVVAATTARTPVGALAAEDG